MMMIKTEIASCIGIHITDRPGVSFLVIIMVNEPVAKLVLLPIFLPVTLKP